MIADRFDAGVERIVQSVRILQTQQSRLRHRTAQSWVQMVVAELAQCRLRSLKVVETSSLSDWHSADAAAVDERPSKSSAVPESSALS